MSIYLYIYLFIYIYISIFFFYYPVFDELVTLTTRIIAAGWDHGPYFDPESSFGGSYTRHGCFGIEGVDLFDCSLADAGGKQRGNGESNGGWENHRKTIGKWMIYPLVICYIAIEHGHRNSGFSHIKWRFSIVM